MSFLKSLASTIKNWKYNLMLNIPSAKCYLSKHLSGEEFLILEHCLNRFDLDYRDLFWFCEDARIHNQMELCAKNKGFSSIEEVFTKEEIGVIKKAQNLLNSAPVSVGEELRVFCHA